MQGIGYVFISFLRVTPLNDLLIIVEAGVDLSAESILGFRRRQSVVGGFVPAVDAELDGILIGYRRIRIIPARGAEKISHTVEPACRIWVLLQRRQQP